MPLTAKQERFVQEYLIDLNATQAAIRAGYSGKGAEVRGSELLRNRKVAEAVQAAMAAREQRTHITQDRVLQELARIAFFDIRRLYNSDGTLKRPDQWDEETAAALSGIDVVEMGGGEDHVPLFTKKAKVFDKTSALTLAMRHLGMLKDKVEMTGRDGGPVLTATLPAEELRQIAAGLVDKV